MMETFLLNIAGFGVQVELDTQLLQLPRNYRPFVSPPQDHNADPLRPDGHLPHNGEDFPLASPIMGGREGGLLLRFVVGREPVDTSGLRKLSSFSDLGYRQDVFERDGGGYAFDISDYDGHPAATMVSGPRFGENRVCLHATEQSTKEFGFNNTLMLAFAFAAAYRQTLMMHSSVVARDGVGYMFLGKSGTGKSTHSSLWLRYLDGYHLLNDDNPVLRIEEGEVVVYGSPWSGKTPCYRQERAKVGALVMLEQKPYNKITRESVVVALSSLMCSCSVMIWDKATYDLILRTIEQVIRLRGVWHLECLPDEAAARLSNSTITKP